MYCPWSNIIDPNLKSFGQILNFLIRGLTERWYVLCYMYKSAYLPTSFKSIKPCKGETKPTCVIRYIPSSSEETSSSVETTSSSEEATEEGDRGSSALELACPGLKLKYKQYSSQIILSRIYVQCLPSCILVMLASYYHCLDVLNCCQHLMVSLGKASPPRHLTKIYTRGICRDVPEILIRFFSNYIFPPESKV